jgi:hypothetical protein
MSQIDRTRRIALQTLLLGAAGAAVAACGGKSPAPAASTAPAADAPPPSTPAAAPAAPPADTAAATPPAAAPTAAPAGGPLPAVDPKDPQAVALGYVTDASTLDPAKNAPYQPGHRCATCVQYKGAADSTEGPCAIFAGRSVKAAGWCKVWVAKPA